MDPANAVGGGEGAFDILLGGPQGRGLLLDVDLVLVAGMLFVWFFTSHNKPHLCGARG